MNHLETLREKTAKRARFLEENEHSQCQEKILLQYKNVLSFKQSMPKSLRQLKINKILEVSKEIIDKKIPHETQLLSKTISSLLRNISEHSDIDIRTNPQDFMVLKPALKKLDKSSFIRCVRLMEDEHLARGSIIIKANKSVIDARIKTQMEALKFYLQSIFNSL